MLDGKIIYHLNYIVNQIGKRILPYYIMTKNYSEMAKWQNQICMQTHVTCAAILSMKLPKNYSVTMWEGIFTDKETGSDYNHSWVFIKNEDPGPYEAYICDVARLMDNIGFRQAVINSPDHFLKDSEKKNLRKEIDWKTTINDIEFYTRRPGTEMLAFCLKALNDIRL